MTGRLPPRVLASSTAFGGRAPSDGRIDGFTLEPHPPGAARAPISLLRGRAGLGWRAALMPRRPAAPRPSVPAGRRSASTTLPALCAAILTADLIGRRRSPMHCSLSDFLRQLIGRDHISRPVPESWKGEPPAHDPLRSRPAHTSIFGDMPAHIPGGRKFTLPRRIFPPHAPFTYRTCCPPGTPCALWLPPTCQLSLLQCCL